MPSTSVEVAAYPTLLPDAAQEVALWETLKLCNQAANHASRRAFETGVKAKAPLQRLVYDDLKVMGLSAQPAIHCVRKAAGAYATLKSNIEAGNLGPRGAKRREWAESKPVMFGPTSAQPFDDRSLSWQLDARAVSIWTVHGRTKGVRFACSPEQAKVLAEHRRGESDLVYRDGEWYLHATCEVSEGDEYESDGFVGVDLGIANIATTSDGWVMAGRKLNRYRRRQQRLRTKLQKKGTTSAKRLLKKRRRRESRRVRDTNHCVSKTIVTEAQRTGRGIALEDLTGIRTRVRRATRSRTQQVNIPERKVMLRVSVQARPRTHMRCQ